MIAAFLLDASRMQYGIDRLALDLLKFQKVPDGRSDRQGQDQIIDGPGRAAEDRLLRRRRTRTSRCGWPTCWSEQLDEIPALRKLTDELETPLIDVLAEMEFNGIAVDPAILKEQSGVLGERIEELREQDPARRPASSSTSIRPSSWPTCCSTS